LKRVLKVQFGHFEGFEILKGFNLRSGLYKRSNTPALKENLLLGGVGLDWVLWVYLFFEILGTPLE